KQGAIDEILDLVAEHRSEIVIAGPAFSAGRYGLACGGVTLRARERLGVIAVTGMHVDNAATEVYRTRLHIASTQRTAAGMADGLAIMARLALKLVSGTALGAPADEGYVPTGRRIFEMAERPAPLRAVEMLLRKVRGEPYTTEWPVPRYHRVPAAPPLQDTAKATIALVTTGGLVPHGNPDRLESGFATKWLRYSIAGVDSLPPERWQSVHGGFNTSRINEDPHRVLPLDVARELEREGVIGRLHPEFYSTTGNTSVIPTMRRFAQEMGRELRAAGVDGVILTST
ncbi:MAG: glycine/betaine/sarcosine/D-proline family reductase selenoprotein B, partial [Candidatus Rokuibacteriota bacterium]